MKIELLDTKKFIDINQLQECDSPKLFSNKNMMEPGGILSNEIFGISKDDRKNTFAYISLNKHFIHPHIYGSILKRLFKNISYIVSGLKRFSIVDGVIYEDENGWTGIDELYNHWDEINWNKSSSNNDRSLKFLKNTPKNLIFIDKLVIIPPFYRDVMRSNATDTSDHVNELNTMYSQTIKLVSIISEGGLFSRTQYTTQAKIQDNLVDIYNYFKDRIKSKYGLIKKYLLGKTVDYGTRAVISSYSFRQDRIEEQMIDMYHCVLPLAQCCSTFYKFIHAYLRTFFTREIINNGNLVSYIDETGKEIVCKIYAPENQFSEKVITNIISDYVENPSNRFKIIKLKALKPDNTPVTISLRLKGKAFLNNKLEDIMRPMTITDLLYLAAVDSCEHRHVMISRYPIGTDKSIVFNRVRVGTTQMHTKVIFNETEYNYYPLIDLSIQNNKVPKEFIDTFVFHNSYLDELGGDFDGDILSIRGLWTEEANAEAEKIMKSKMSSLTVRGDNIRVTGKEIFNSFYELTKLAEPQKQVSPEDVEKFLGMRTTDLTKSFIFSLFADTLQNGKIKKSKYNTYDIIKVPQDYFYSGQKEITTTIGRVLVNRFVLEASKTIPHTKFVDGILNKSGLSNLDSVIGKMFLNDVITEAEYFDYTNRRDTLGYWTNGILAHTISERMVKPLPEVMKKKAELLEKYKTELANKDLVTMKKVEDELIAYAQEVLKDDPGMDLYLSGDLDFSNNYKSNSIIRGPVYNNITKEYDFLDNSLMEGLRVQDIPTNANGIVAGVYPGAIATAAVGYLGKQLLSLMQMIRAGEKDSDCGTKRTIPVSVTKFNKNDLIDSYIDNNGQRLLLTDQNIGSFIGKQIHMYSPMTCCSERICNKCLGELFYKLGFENVGLGVSKLSYSLLNLNLKSKHDLSVSIRGIDDFNKYISDI